MLDINLQFYDWKTDVQTGGQGAIFMVPLSIAGVYNTTFNWHALKKSCVKLCIQNDTVFPNTQ